MKQVTISIPDEKYASFIKMIHTIDYVQLDEKPFHISEEQMNYVLNIKSKTKIENMIDSEVLFDELDKQYL